ncbi:MAG: OmpA family protein [Acidobacteria bacterium]|nr:OmpA family protein [Acidobacteriota bacterium]
MACLFLLILGEPTRAVAMQWPWGNKKPHELAAQCSVEPQQVERGSKERLQARIEATDSLGHDLAYAWSSNGGRILGNGPAIAPAIEVDASQLPPGVYSVLAAAQDGYKQQTRCAAHFQVVRPSNHLSMSCAAEPAVLEAGEIAHLKALATDSLGYELRYNWFTNGGTLQGEGPEASLDTTGLRPGQYSITGRAEDGWGVAADCVATITVRVVAPPPLPPEPLAVASIVFAPNQSILEESRKAQLDPVLERFRQEPAARISIESYAGPEEKQPGQLAAARAEAVKLYLVERGAEESRIQTLVGLGGKLGGLRNRTLDVIWLPEGAEY